MTSIVSGNNLCVVLCYSFIFCACVHVCLSYPLCFHLLTVFKRFFCVYHLSPRTGVDLCGSYCLSRVSTSRSYYAPKLSSFLLSLIATCNFCDRWNFPAKMIIMIAGSCASLAEPRPPRGPGAAYPLPTKIYWPPSPRCWAAKSRRMIFVCPRALTGQNSFL